ncbi:MAG: succinyl-CoA synthetase subunit alpha [Candidatus Aenigmarchaeota archaeon]|nr:succinyl-CoA synthetase subunit alpha [Candidatus Aenigmarchaeota archaeon]
MQRSKEFEFYVKTDLSKYKGQYIAIVDDRVVASGGNAKKVIEEAKIKTGKTPLLAKIPGEEALILWSPDIKVG